MCPDVAAHTHNGTVVLRLQETTLSRTVGRENDSSREDEREGQVEVRH